MTFEWASAARARPLFERSFGNPWVARTLFMARMIFASVRSWRLEAEALEGAAMQTTNNAASSTRRTDVTDMGLSLGTAHPTKAHGKTRCSLQCSPSLKRS
jgi:hypothetical protein